MRLRRKRPFARSRSRCRSQLVEQRLCLFKIRCVEAFGEPGVDGREHVAGLGAAALVTAESSEADGSAQFPQLCFLSASDIERLSKLRLRSGRITVPQELPAVTHQLRLKPI